MNEASKGSAMQNCQSCGMSIESGPYCQYCVDENGNLQDFDERLQRMAQFVKTRNTGISQQEAEKQTLEYRATMPAWRDHPRVVKRH